MFELVIEFEMARREESQVTVIGGALDTETHTRKGSSKQTSYRVKKNTVENLADYNKFFPKRERNWTQNNWACEKALLPKNRNAIKVHCKPPSASGFGRNNRLDVCGKNRIKNIRNDSAHAFTRYRRMALLLALSVGSILEHQLLDEPC